MMSRKDYERIAEAIRRTRAVEGGPACITRVMLATDIADALRGTNPRFDYRRFVRAATEEA